MRRPEPEKGEVVELPANAEIGAALAAFRRCLRLLQPWECPIFGVTDLAPVGGARVEAAFEGDGEGVQGRLPADGPGSLPLPVGPVIGSGVRNTTARVRSRPGAATSSWTAETRWRPPQLPRLAGFPGGQFDASSGRWPTGSRRGSDYACTACMPVRPNRHARWSDHNEPMTCTKGPSVDLPTLRATHSCPGRHTLG